MSQKYLVTLEKSGRFRPREGLEMKTARKLSGTACLSPLIAMSFVVGVSQEALSQQSDTITLPQVNVNTAASKPSRPARGGSRGPSPATQAPLPPVDVNANKETARGPVRGYVATRSSTGSKTDTRILENPQSISVVTKDQISAQGARSIAEALRYEPGVVSETRVGDRFDNVFVRGFGGFGGNANYLHFWDGLRLPKGVSYAMPSVDPYLLERVEILRGPASVLYGQNNVGGMVNLISKNPTSVPYNEIMTRFGDHNRIESGFDLSGPVDKNGELSYRLIGLARKSDTEVNYTTTERELIAPTITWRPSVDTTLTVRASYDHDPSSYQPNWLPALGTLQANPNGQIPKSFFVGNPYYNSYDRKQGTVGYEFEHHFNDTWTARQNFRYMDVSSEFRALSASGYVAGSNCPAGTPATNACIARSSTHFIERLRSATIDNQVEAKFATGWLQHTVLAGLDYQSTTASALSGNGATTYVNYLNPVYNPLPEPVLTTKADQERKQLGLYAQDQIRFGKLAVSLGIRNDWADATSLSRTISTGATVSSKPSDSATTYRAGATYLFDNGFAPYVSYATSFDPTLGNDYAGKAFVPTTGEQYEVGLKYQPVGTNAIFMISYYDLRQQNVLTFDTAHTVAANPLCTQGAGTSNCQIQVGEVHSKGLELSAKATLSAGLDLIASYTHTDIVTSKSTQFVGGIPLQGKVPVGAPANTSGVWLDYTHQDGPLAGFGYGGGVRYVGSSFGDNINSNAMIVPSFTLADAAIHYDLAGASAKLKGWKLAVNMTNIFDKRYVSACATATQCFYGNGRTTLGTVKFQW